MAEAILAGRGLEKTYRQGAIDARVLRGVDLAVRRGEFLVILGPSGSGKSTLLHLLGLMDRPTAGEVLFDGRPASKLAEPERARLRSGKLGFVFQFDSLLPEFTLLENAAMPGRIAGDAEAEPKARRLLADLGLERLSGRLPQELSGGERQRGAIARALVNGPAVLLADEPTGNLDTRTSIEVMDIFQKLNRERGITVLLITHEMDIAEYGTRIVTFRDGQVVADRSVAKRRLAQDELAALPPPQLV
jgi:putative ABC transport system ATP-binding protein